MRNKKTIILTAIALLVLIGLGIGYYMYSKPRQSAANEASAATLPATALYKQYQDNEQAANQKYLGKVIEVQGNLAAISHNNGMDVLSISSESPAGGINCQLFSADNATTVKVGDAITIKGKCTGFLMDVNLVDCIIK